MAGGGGGGGGAGAGCGDMGGSVGVCRGVVSLVGTANGAASAGENRKSGSAGLEPEPCCILMKY